MLESEDGTAATLLAHRKPMSLWLPQETIRRNCTDSISARLRACAAEAKNVDF
jgi:hypothetical protein